jgi:hypothetical protein
MYLCIACLFDSVAPETQGFRPPWVSMHRKLGLDRASRLRNSTLAEVVLLGLAGVSVAIVRHEFPYHFSTWLSLVSDAVHIRTWAG